MKFVKAMLVLTLVLGQQFIKNTPIRNGPDEYALAPSPKYQTGDYNVYLPLVIKARQPLYDRVAAVSHADLFAHDRSGDYPNYGTGCECNDCTNYASQVLHKGNYPLRTGDWDPENVFEWWYKKVWWWYENSKTWSATDWFNTYLNQYPEEFEYVGWNDVYNLESGDIIIMDTRENDDDGGPPDGIPDHIRVVVGNGYTSTDYDAALSPILFNRHIW